MSDPRKNQISEILLSSEAIEARVAELAQEITASLASHDGYSAEEPLLVVSILKGGAVFACDLVREMNIPIEIDYVHARSYGTKKTAGDLTYHIGEVASKVQGRSVLLLDDIFDTGNTLQSIAEELAREGASVVLTATLLMKEGTQKTDFRPSHVAFTVPNLFVVGYGLDYAERYRELPFIAVLQ